MRQIAVIALAGWSMIMSSGWFLADRRASRCPDAYNCVVDELGKRDAFLILGLLVPFLVAVSFAILNARRIARINLPAANLARPLLARIEGTADIHSAQRTTTLLRGHWLPVAAMTGAAFALGWLSASARLEQLQMRSDPSVIDAAALDAAENVEAGDDELHSK